MNLKSNLINNNFITNAFEIYSFLPRRRKFQVVFIFLIMVVNAISEIFLVAAVIPFIGLISNPDKFLESPFLKYFNFSNTLEFSEIFKTVLFAYIGVVFFATTLKLINMWLIEKISGKIGSDLSVQIYRRTLYKSYLSQLNQNSSKVISNITIQVVRTINACKLYLKMITSFLVGSVIFITLIYVDKYIALSVSLILSIAYLTIVYLVRNQIKANSKEILSSSRARIKILQESIGGIRDLILRSSQQVFINFYRKRDKSFFELRSDNNYLAMFPRVMLQGVSLIFLSLIAAFFTIRRQEEGSIIAILGGFAIGLQRMIPQFQQVYISWAKIRDASSDINAVISSIKQPIDITEKPDNNLIEFQKITLKNVYFKYANNQNYVLKNINLEIKKGEKIGFIGSTGSGKTTTIDIIMGLLKPNKGKILIDNEDIFDEKNKKLLINWRNSISHVPQSIFLADSSVAENIAFGERVDRINMKNIEIASKKAHIHNFIKKLFQGYNSYVGERGVQLSGGQLQRLGIARALYLNTDILVFDEATSSLDVKVEKNIMDDINNFTDKKLLIMISHRYSTLKNCDYIFKIENGRLIEEGTPSQILENN